MKPKKCILGKELHEGDTVVLQDPWGYKCLTTGKLIKETPTGFQVEVKDSTYQGVRTKFQSPYQLAKI